MKVRQGGKSCMSEKLRERFPAFGSTPQIVSLTQTVGGRMVRTANPNDTLDVTARAMDAAALPMGGTLYGALHAE
jgi:hypothetical protein